METGWFHQTQQNGEYHGLRDSGIETFRDNPILELARETIQNALDARACSETPVRVSFSLDHISTRSIPGYAEFLQTMKKCRAAVLKNDTQAEEFFANAETILQGETIPVLMIEDSATTGIRGPCDVGTQYHAYMKSTGISQKESDTAGGSFGIGKLAPYTVSNLRTVFVSTVYKDEAGKKIQLTQGKAVLTSFFEEKENGALKSATGYWGVVENCMPVSGIRSVPDWVLTARCSEELQQKQGTKISVLGFSAADTKWQDMLACSVAENFFGAILNKALIVEVAGRYTFDADSLESFFRSSEVRSRLNDEYSTAELERFTTASQYYVGLREPVTAEKEIKYLGKCRLHILVKDGLPKKVGILRNGMFITDSGIDNLKRFGDFKDFIAVFYCESDEGNRLLRAMEPPCHDRFAPDRLKTPGGRGKKEEELGKKVLSELGKWVRSELKEKARIPVTEETRLDELDDVLGMEGKDGNSGNGAEINPMGKLYHRAKPFRFRALRTTPAAENSLEDDAGFTEGEGSGSPNGGRNEGAPGKIGGTGNSGSGGGGYPAGQPVSIQNVRAVGRGPNSRLVSFEPQRTGQFAVRIREAGADLAYRTDILASDAGMVKNGEVILTCTEKKKLSFTVTFSEPVKGAVKVNAYEI